MDAPLAAHEFPFPVVACHTDERGDGLAASKKLLKGELVLRTAPVAAVPKDHCLLTVCACCFRWGSPQLPLTVCASCRSVAHCARCMASGLAARRHDRHECGALAMLMHMKAGDPVPALTTTEPTATTATTTVSRSRKVASRDAGTQGVAAKRGPARRTTAGSPAGLDPATQATSSAPPKATATEDTSPVHDTATLRLVLAIGCFMARQRQRAVQQKQRARCRRNRRRRGSQQQDEAQSTGRRVTTGGEAHSADGTGSGSGSDAGSSDGELFGSGDVVQDSGEDVELLFGEQEDLAPEEQQKFSEAVACLKVVQPACARASLAVWLQWATKVHLNAHDVLRGAAGGTSGGPPPGSTRAGAPQLPGDAAAQPSAVGAAAQGASSSSSSSSKRTRSGAKLLVKHELGGSAAAGVGRTAAAAAEASQQQQQQALHRPGSVAVGEGLFPSAARFNHACVPNVAHTLDEWGCLETRVCAEGGVQAGEELFAAYINPDAPRDVRRLHLLQHYGFDCHCPKCEAGL